MKYLFYLLPGLLNVIMGLFFFITAKRLADAGASSLAVTATTAMWALIYAAVSMMAGKISRRSNAVNIMLISQLILLTAMLGLLFSPDVKMQYIWLLLSGLGTGLFFTPFQTVVKMFEKVEISPGTFARSAAVYTFSWSMGQGSGPLVAALVWGAFDPVNGWKYCYMINIFVVLMIIFTLCIMLQFIRKKLSEENASAPASAPDANTAAPAADTIQNPDIMKAVWFMAFGGFLGVAMLRAYLPDYATKSLALDTATQGYAIALISLVQGIVALSCIKARRWPFKSYMLLGATLCAAISLLILANAPSGIATCIAAAFFGCFSGILAFSMTYHALANADKSSRYAAVNETIVGSTALLAPVGAGLLADTISPRLPFYLLLSIILICAVCFVIQLKVLKAKEKNSF